MVLQVQEKLAKIKKAQQETAAARGNSERLWVEVFDPGHDAFYYWDQVLFGFSLLFALLL